MYASVCDFVCIALLLPFVLGSVCLGFFCFFFLIFTNFFLIIIFFILITLFYFILFLSIFSPFYSEPCG